MGLKEEAGVPDLLISGPRLGIILSAAISGGILHLPGLNHPSS